MEIQSLSQWYTSLDEQSKNVEKYEDTMAELFNKLNKPESELYKPTMKGFYKKLSIRKNLINIIKTFLLPLLVFMGFFILFLWIYMLYSLHINPIAAVRVFGLECLFKSSLIGLVITSIIGLISLGCKCISICIIKNKLAKIETQIEPILSTIPPEYRTSERMQMIAKIFYTKRDVEPDIAISVCGDMMYKNATRYFEPILYDIDCNNKYIIQETNKPINEDQSINQDNKINEYLPSDIQSKTFKGSDNSENDLNQMIGLDSVKSQIDKLKNRIEFYGKAQNNGNHMTFLGGAGTGKTTVARIITKILFDLGIIEKNQYVEISGDYLRSGDSYRVSAIMEYSMGGVLFIDEAYLLYDKNGRGAEATGILLKAMEDHRKDFVVILAGYEEQMTKLLASNEGFASRIKHTIYFPDYTVDEMFNIFNAFINNYNGKSYRINEDAKTLLIETFELEKKSKSFGNARTVRNAVDSIMDYYVDRNMSNNTNDFTIQLADVEQYNKDRKTFLQHELKNLSASNQLDESIIRLSELKSKLKNGSINPDEDLSKLVGLESFKNEIDILRNQKKFYDQMVHQKILLLGEDGCGKSTITSILTGYLHQMGYIQENKYLEIPAEMLKGSYVGHTAKRAEAIISYASGGVLYIKNYNTLAENTDSFSNEAISAITTAITENKDVTIVLADKPSQSINMIRNLFTLVYEFPIYTNEQLLQIFDMQVASQNFVTDDNTRQQVYNYIVANNVSIRDIQQIFNNTVKQHIVNFNGDENYKYVLSSQDLVFPQSYVQNIPKMPNNIKLNIITNKNNKDSEVIKSQSVTIDNNETVEEKKPTQTIKLNFKPKS